MPYVARLSMVATSSMMVTRATSFGSPFRGFLALTSTGFEGLVTGVTRSTKVFGLSSMVTTHSGSKMPAEMLFAASRALCWSMLPMARALSSRGRDRTSSAREVAMDSTETWSRTASTSSKEWAPWVNSRALSCTAYLKGMSECAESSSRSSSTLWLKREALASDLSKLNLLKTARTSSISCGSMDSKLLNEKLKPSLDATTLKDAPVAVKSASLGVSSLDSSLLYSNSRALSRTDMAPSPAAL
mmetsp:Transcript_38421/g.69635  ORF Transcript_38421/g.69635 Transcript_38421/m.69635 type:complete len:244 (+) Transcript_38421:988-1719(+)